MKFMKNIGTQSALSLLALALVGGNAIAASDEPTQQVTIIDSERSDPFEGFNRAMWDFNRDYLDYYLAKPAAIFYKNYIPAPVQSSIYNAASNLEEPPSTVNNLLQGNVEDSGNAFARFLINSTVGVFGLFDVADKIGLSRKEDEFGEVLAVYGVDDGPYIMLPALGPTTLRNEIGDQVDNLYFPAANIALWSSVGIKVLKGIHVRSQLLEQEGLINGALDPYTFVQEAYYQQRLYNIYDGKVPVIEEELDVDDFDDIDDL